MGDTTTTTSTTQVALGQCVSCSTPLGRRRRHWWAFWEDSCGYECDDPNCSIRLCSTCYNKRPLYTVPQEPQPANGMEHATIKKFCQSCFEAHSAIDFSKTYSHIVGSSGITFVCVHGGSGSRCLFQAHAEELNHRYGHGALLMDLPGHATLVNTPLTLESCAETLRHVLNDSGVVGPSGTGSRGTGEKLIYLGGSLGAYIGFYLLEQSQDYFQGAILLDCGQNVGPGASIKARLGLAMLSMLGRYCSNATLLKMMADVTSKSPADYKLLETNFGAGMFFEQATAQVDCLKAVAPADYIPKIRIPILFMNGSMDYRDSENRWYELCCVSGGDDNKSQLKVYDGGDHFFTHDTRFLEDILTRWNKFASSI